MRGIEDSPIRGYLIGSLVLLGLTLVAMLAVALSPTAVYWTGDRVPAVQRGGVVYYTYHGRQLTLPGPGEVSDPVPHAASVHVNPDDPSDALVDDVRRWIDAGFVLVWPLAAVLCLAAGLLRRRLQSRSGWDGGFDAWDFTRRK